MARSEEVTVSGDGTFTQLTNADATKITLKNQGENVVGLYGSATGTAPTPDDADQGLVLFPGQAVVGVLVADLFPGVTGADRVFGRAQRDCKVFVSHDG